MVYVNGGSVFGVLNGEKESELNITCNYNSFMQNSGTSIAISLEIPQSCTKPSIWSH